MASRFIHSHFPTNLFSSEISGDEVGLAITQCIALCGVFQWGMRQSAELENQMTSVERILEFTRVEHEPSLESVIFYFVRVIANYIVFYRSQASNHLPIGRRMGALSMRGFL